MATPLFAWVFTYDFYHVRGLHVDVDLDGLVLMLEEAFLVECS